MALILKSLQGGAAMKKSIILVVLFLFTHASFSAEFEFNCSFDGEEGDSIHATSGPYDFELPFQGPFMPTSFYFANSTPELFTVEAKETSGLESQDLDLFVTKKLNLSHYSDFAKEILSETIDLSSVETVRIAFPTNLYLSFIYVEITSKTGQVTKMAFTAGFPPLQCK